MSMVEMNLKLFLYISDHKDSLCICFSLKPLEYGFFYLYVRSPGTKNFGRIILDENLSTILEESVESLISSQ
jgi:hypothetical protein